MTRSCRISALLAGALAALGLAGVPAPGAAQTRFLAMTVEGAIRPLAVTTAKPRFGWQSETGYKGAISRYEVDLGKADPPALLRPGRRQIAVAPGAHQVIVRPPTATTTP
jgi:hypothetical protein